MHYDGLDKNIFVGIFGGRNRVCLYVRDENEMRIMIHLKLNGRFLEKRNKNRSKQETKPSLQFTLTRFITT